MIDILYVNYNSSDVLQESIASAFKSDAKMSINVFVWDNHSTDDISQIKRNFPQINLFISNQNIGFAKGINQLVKRSASPYLVFLNPDTVVENGFIKKTIEFLEENPDVGIVGPKVLNPDGTVQGSARKFPDPLTSLFGRSSPLSKLFPNNSITARNILTLKNGCLRPIEVDWVSGACMVIRREVLNTVGGFDERFFLYWEDADLCRRIKRSGWKVIYYPDAEIIHRVGESSNTRPVFANYQFHKSCYRLYEKYARWPLSTLAPMAGIALMLRFLAAVIFNQLYRILHRILATKTMEKTIGDPVEKVRILRVISRMNIGGPSIHVKNLTEYLDPARFSTRLITGSVSPGEGDMGYITDFKKYVRISVPELQREISIYYDMVALMKVLYQLHRIKPDIIHSHTSKAGTLSRLAAMLYNIPLKKKMITVHTFHGNVLDGYFSKAKSYIFLMIERCLSHITDRIIAISESQRYELSSVYKICCPKKIDTIKLGFDLSPFLNCSSMKGMLRRKLNISTDTLLIAIIGRMAPIKNHKMFLDSAKLLIGMHRRKDIRFILVGDGEERPFLEKYVQQTGINDRVIFHGWEKNIPMVYADIDILALTSLNEGTPVSVIEAMAAQVPVVTTGVGGIKDLLGAIEEKQPDQAIFKLCQRGILCPKDDPHTFCNALAYMIDGSHFSDHERLRRAREHVVRNYSVDRLVNDVECLYEKLMTSRTVV